MQIKSVLSRFSDLATLGRRSELAEPTIGKKVDAVTSSAGSAAGSDALKKIAAQYDVTAITPKGFSEMLERLRQSGAVSDQEFQDLSKIRVELAQDGIQPNEEVNLLEHYQQKLATLAGQSPQDATSNSASAPLQRHVQWLQKFALLHATPDAFGLDAAG